MSSRLQSIMHQRHVICAGMSRNLHTYAVTLSIPLLSTLISGLMCKTSVGFKGTATAHEDCKPPGSFYPGLPPIASGLASPKFLHHFCDGIGRVGGKGRCCKQTADVTCKAAIIAVQALPKHGNSHLQLCRESENGYGNDKKGPACINIVSSKVFCSG